MEWIALGRLRAFEGNANVMEAGMFEKLVGHIQRSGRYPPLIVRSIDGEDGEDGGDGEQVYEVLDGHHRWRALERLGHEAAACVVWEVDDGEAALLLATLNRLSGRDDPAKRAALLGELRERLGRDAEGLAELLPETAEQVQRWLDVRAKPLRPVEPRGLGEMPVAVHFFLSGEQKQRLEAALKALGGTREEALMRMVEGVGGV